MTSAVTARMPRGGFNALVPELDVSDLATSLAFWCGPLGFTVAYDRPEENFAYLERDGAQVMLCAINGNWQTGPLDLPLGRGINLQIAVASVDPILEALTSLPWPLFRTPHDTRYRVGGREVHLRQFLVQDPDGYLLRFAESPGENALTPGGRAWPR